MSLKSLLSPTRPRKDPYDFPLLSPLNTDDLHRRSFDDQDNYEDISWDESFERSERPRGSSVKKMRVKVIVTSSLLFILFLFMY
jgi:hypothetical protein